MWRYNILFLLILGGCFHALAQTVAFSASPSASKIGVKDYLQVTFTLTNLDNISDFRPSGFGDFDKVNGPFQQQSMSITNGARSSSISLTYVLHPKHEGKLTIPPAIAKDNAGHNYYTNALVIEVVPGSLAQQQQPRQQNNPFGDDDDPFQQIAAQMQRMNQMHQRMMQQAQPQQMAPQQQRGGQQPQQAQADAPVNDAEISKDLFIRVTVDKSKVHVGEQITTSYKLYSRLPMQVAISKLPALNGFWTSDFDIPKMPKPMEEVVNGKKYQVFLLKKSALFPQEAGTLELDPAEAKGQARVVQQVKRKVSDLFNDPFGSGTLMMNDPFFNNAVFNTMAYKDVAVHLKSTPVKITVTPLPEKEKPEGFGGAVGSFTFTSKLDKQELTTDDVANLTLNITGSGNFKLIEAPKLNLPNGINTYDPQVIDTITGRSTTISGSKIITYDITPQTPGDYTIPPISFSYFNPTLGAYTTIKTQPFTLHVKPGKNPTGNKVNPALAALKDIHDIKATPLDNLGLMSKPLMLSPIYMSMYLLPLIAFFGMIVWRRKNDELENNSMLMRNKRANKEALKRLVTAKALMLQKQRKLFYEEISKAIWLYLSDKLGIPLSSLSRDTAIAALIDRKVPDLLHRQFNDLVWECETALYATGGSKPLENTYDDAVKLIGDFEDTIA